MAVLVELIFIVLSLCGPNLASCLSAELEIVVSPDCANSSQPNCTDLDSALSSLDSNTILLLESGEHVLREYHGQSLWNITNISLIGADDSVRITCQPHSNTGLVFINVTNLTLSNITVDGCGLSNASLEDATTTVKSFLDLTFTIPESLKIGIFLAHCNNMKISNCLITNTLGLGMLGINILGNSSLSNVNFINNTCPGCSDLSSIPQSFMYGEQDIAGIGGGAYFLYQDPLHDAVHQVSDYNLMEISHCNFSHNAENSQAGYFNINYQYNREKDNHTYTVGGGGGLSVFMPQQTFPANVSVSNSMFHKNFANYGAGAHIGLFAGFSVNQVLFWNCTFDSNGLMSSKGVTESFYSRGGGGIAVFVDLLKDSNAPDITPPKEVCTSDCKIKSVKFVDTLFTHNSASFQGGGMLVYSLSKHFRSNYNPEVYNATILLSRCSFLNNTAIYGLALYMSQFATHGLDGSWALSLEHTIVDTNHIVSVHEDRVGSSYSNDRTSAVDLRGVTVLIQEGWVTITDNSASGLHLQSSIVIMSQDTSLIVRNNLAYRGGGVYMEGNIPLLVPSRNCCIDISGNVAVAEGGGVFYETHLDLQARLDPINTVDCFLTTNKIYKLNGDDLFESDIVIRIEDNQAPSGGAIFGSTLRSCSWARNLDVPQAEMLNFLHTNHSSTFKFSSAPVTKEQVSSGPHFIRINENDTHLSAYPGENRSLTLNITDIFGNDVDTVITADAGDRNSHNFTLGQVARKDWGYWFWYFVSGHKLRLNIQGKARDSLNVSLYAVSTVVSTDITVDILECPIGFYYNPSTQRCDCDDKIRDKLTIEYCDTSSVKLIVPPGKWLGCMNSSNCSSSDDLILIDCSYGYCKSNQSDFDPTNFDNQCAEDSNRTGIMCGMCKENFSLLMDSYHCRECKPSDIWVLMTLNVVGGFVLFCGISLFGFTIEKGWPNMVLLFGNIIYPYSIFNSDKNLTFFKNMLVPTRWLSLQLGIDLCITDNFDSTSKSFARLAFFLYLYTLLALFTLWCRYSSFASRHFSPSKTLITLIIFSYIPMVKVCAGVLSPVVLENLAGTEKSYGWRVDPNVRFIYDWRHGLLFCLACLLIILVILPLLLLMLSPSLAYKYGQRFKPFLDALWAPYKPKFRRWVVVRIAIRILVNMFGVFLIPPHQRNSVIVNLMFLSTFLCAQTLIQPFHSQLVNILDNFLVLITVIMNYVFYYWYERLFHSHNTNAPSNAPSKLEMAYFSIPLLLAYTVIAGSLLWYTFQSPKIRQFLWTMRRCCCCCCLKGKKLERLAFDTAPTQTSIQSRPTYSYTSVSTEIDPPRRPKNFSRYRDSIFEEDDFFDDDH